jgi:hypothetical protein
MNVASDCKAAAFKFRLCFFRIRNATGRSVAGGRRIGRIVVTDGLNAGGGGAGTRPVGGNGWSGVAKAGEDE